MKRAYFPGLLVLVFVSSACSQQEAIIERFTECRDLMADSKMNEQILNCFDARGRKLLKALQREKKKTVGSLKYLARHNTLLNSGDTFGEVEFHGDFALLPVSKGMNRETVVFRKEDGQWRIELIELSRFWRELDQGVRQ